MIAMTYRLRAYESRKAGESGRFTASTQHQTGSWPTAQHEAKQLATEYGACVVENLDTGNREWFGK